MDLDMKIQPSFYDEECAIVFSFYFNKAKKKIGEAVIYTCDEKGEHQDSPVKCKPQKSAYLKEFSICKEYEELSMDQIRSFLHIIGINNISLKVS